MTFRESGAATAFFALPAGPAFSQTSRYRSGSGGLSAHRSTVSWRADRVAHSLTRSSYPTLSPFSLFESYLATCPGQRDVCFRGPHGGGRDCALR